MLINELKNRGITDSVCKDYPNIHFLNGFSIKKETEHNGEKTEGIISLFRYVPFFYAANDCFENTLTFVSPALWNDQFEKAFLFTDFKSKSFLQKKIRCLCFRDNGAVNEEAAWNAFAADKPDLPIRIRYNTEKLLENLQKYAQENNARIFIGNTIYGLGIDDIKTIAQKDTDLYKLFFKGKFSEKNYLSLLLIKRNAFVYENEVRIFIYYDNIKGDTEKSKKLIEPIPLDYTDLIKEIKISPKCKKSDIPLVKDVLERIFKEKVSKNNIKQTNLYENKFPVEKVT